MGVWAYYHVIRQHYGFMVLYKVKNRDLAPLDNFLDRVFLGVMTGASRPSTGSSFIIPKNWASRSRSRGWNRRCWALVAVTVGASTSAGSGARSARGDAVDLPKFLLFGGVIPLHWLTFAYMSWQAAVPTVTIVHNLQYHALVWFHNRNRYAGRTPSGTGAFPPR